MYAYHSMFENFECHHWSPPALSCLQAKSSILRTMGKLQSYYMFQMWGSEACRGWRRTPVRRHSPFLGCFKSDCHALYPHCLAFVFELQVGEPRMCCSHIGYWFSWSELSVTKMEIHSTKSSELRRRGMCIFVLTFAQCRCVCFLNEFVYIKHVNGTQRCLHRRDHNQQRRAISQGYKFFTRHRSLCCILLLTPIDLNVNV